MIAGLTWQPYLPAALALLVALALALAGRLRLGALPGVLAAGAGLLLGWWWMFGVLTASPRQLPERLPLLALALLGWVLLAHGLARRRLPALPLALLGAAFTGWWMAGAPRTLADLTAAAPVLAGVTLGAALALRAEGWAGAMAALALWLGLMGASLPGPGVLLGLVLAAAALGAALGGAARGALACLPVAAGLAALAALPLLARGAPADWAAAAAPLAVLWLGPPLASRLPRALGPAGGALLAALPCLAAAWWLGGRLP